MSNRIIPYSTEAEESLLGNILLYKDAMRQCIDGEIYPDDFYLERHQIIYNIMRTMYENKEKVDTVSLSTKLKDFGVFDKIGGLEYLMQLTGSTISATNTKEYISIVKNKSLARKIIHVGEEIANDAYDGKVEVAELLENAERKVIEVTRSQVSSDFMSGEEVFDNTIKHIEAIQEAGSRITGVKTDFEDLDRMTAGFQKGDLIIVAARSSMGKTTFALNVALNSAGRNPGSVAIFSIEQPAEQIAMRILSAKSNVPFWKLNTGILNDEDWSKINEASQQLKKMSFYIDDSSGIKVSEIYAKCRKLAQEHDLFLVIVDYLQLVQATGKGETREREVADISRSLKAMARELNVPVIAVSQLSRSVEQRNDKRPMLSDLRESGSIEQDADLVLMLYRDSYYNPDNESEDASEEVELSIAKHRNGPTGRIKLSYQKDIFRFYGLTDSNEVN